jgi:hypothetical protein
VWPIPGKKSFQQEIGLLLAEDEMAAPLLKTKLYIPPSDLDWFHACISSNA